MKLEARTYNRKNLVLEKDLIGTLAYFHVFKHPLQVEELSNFSSVHNTNEQVELTLKKLLQQKFIFEKQGYYSIAEKIEEEVKSRELKEKEALKYWKKSERYSRLIHQFPFVRGVAISGSLSKGVMAKDGDVDYFIITEPNRLWLTRTLLILFKKIVLLNSRKYFCVNYFVDTEHLEILDKNVFTATEIKTLIPMTAPAVFNQFDEINSWTKKHYPNFIHPNQRITEVKDKRIKRTLEKIFSGSLGEKLDLYFMKITVKKWEKKFPSFSKAKFELTLRSQRGVSKHHPRDFQNQVLLKWEENKQRIIKALES